MGESGNESLYDKIVKKMRKEYVKMNRPDYEVERPA